VSLVVLPPTLNDFVVVFVSIVLQSLPFVLIGVVASALVQRHLSERALARWLPTRPAGVVLASSLLGFVAPVCDCGAVPLARRLAAKGLPGYGATAFLVAAPVVNPVVLLSTAIAFQGDWAIVALRMGMTLSVALTVGLLASRAGLDLARAPAAADAGGEDAGLRGLVGHASAEFVDVMFFVVLGALFTAATQTLVPRGQLAAFGGRPVASVLALMPVATLLSICSEADAFVARAFATTFTTGAVLAFMTVGQIVDLRNGFLMARTLGPRLVGLVLAVSYGLVFVEAVLVNAVGGRP
jgi:uncharacterized membrane protein YraQ (UPF0718 family)